MEPSQNPEVRDIIMSGTRALVGIAARSLAGISADVSLAQYRVLVLLDGRGTLTMSDLANSLDVNPSTVTRVCDLLVDKKLIRRKQAPNNRRTVCAELTARGKRLVDKVMTHREALIDDALTKMSPEAQRRLGRGLAEFALAAGEVADHAWTLGWTLDADSADVDGPRLPEN
jgi:DNA-binding MarR family transcriptional regulator